MGNDTMTIRRPVLAGSFYPETKKEIESEIKRLLHVEEVKIKPFPQSCEIVGAILPHAGYAYSGNVTCHFFQPISKYPSRYDTIILLTPDHRGLGDEVAIDSNAAWETPLGTIDIDTDLARLLNLRFDSKPHMYEHSGEVLIPFIQHFFKYNVKILPIAISHQVPEVAKKVAVAIFEALKKSNKRILMLASSDFSHYISPEKGVELDELVINEISNLNSESIYQTIRNERISMCGYGPVMTLIEYSKLLNYEVKTKFLARGNSGRSGKLDPFDEVVNYNSILFYY